MDLVKLGPGLGPRLNIWQKVYVWFSDNNFEFLTVNERESIKQLANGKPWSEFIPSEWWNIYSSIFDEYETIALDEREKSKIEKDVPRTFTLFARSARYLRINFPSDMEPYHHALTIVLRLAAIDRGYCQGVNFIAAQLLLELADAKQAFIVLSYLLKNCQLEILFDSRYSALFDYMRIFEKKLRKHNERLYKHFKRCEFRASSYAVEWFTTCFIVTCPGEFALTIIDMILAGVNDIMIRMGLSLLTTLQHRLIRLDFEKLHECFKDYCMKADIVYVIVNALKVQFQINNSVIKAMAKKIELLDPTSEGDLKFGKSKTTTPTSLVTKVRRTKKKQKSRSHSLSDDSLSSEGEIESELQNLDLHEEVVPIQLALHTPTIQEQILEHEQSEDDEGNTSQDKTESILQFSESADTSNKSHHQTQPQPKTDLSNHKTKTSKFTIAITPKRFNHWKNLHRSRSLPPEIEEGEESEFLGNGKKQESHQHNHINGGVTRTTKDFQADEQSPSIIQAFPEIRQTEKTILSTSLDSTRKLALIPPPPATLSEKSESNKNSSSWFNFGWNAFPSLRSTKSNASEISGTSPLSTVDKLSFSGRISENQSPTTASCSPTFSLPRHKDSHSAIMKSEDLESVDVKAWSAPTRQFKRIRVWEQFNITSYDDEEAIIYTFYQNDQYDSLLLLHVHPILLDSRSISSEDENDVWRTVDSPKGENTMKETTFSPQRSKPQEITSSPSYNTSTTQRSDSQGFGSPQQKEFIDQGGEVVSSSFYKRNHLIAEVIEKNGLKEDYFVGKLRIEGGKKKSLRSRRVSTASHRHYQIKGHSKSKKPLTRAARAKTFPAEAAAAKVNAVYRADQTENTPDKEVLKQYAMYSRVMFK